MSAPASAPLQPPRAGAAPSSAAGRAPLSVVWRGRPIEIEWGVVEAGPPGAPPAAAAAPRRVPHWVFLHEGLGSRSAWRDTPLQIAQATGLPAFVHSRPGYGQSTPRPASERWGVDFLHQQAHEVLPAVLQAAGLESGGEGPLRHWLFGHSDGASIALLYAARFPERVAGLVLLAPHLFVEDRSIAGIQAARVAYREGPLREGLARHHADPDSAFWGWNDIWLDPAFRAWRIDDEVLPALAQARLPILAVQGEDDTYGTMAQIDAIAEGVPGTERLKLPACGHAPHREHPHRVAEAVAAFLRRHTLPAPAALRS